MPYLMTTIIARSYGKMKMTIKDVPDSELIVRIGKDDAEAFTELWQRYEKMTLSFFRRLLSDTQSALDCRQELFTSIWNNGCGYKGGNAKAYIFSIARNTYCTAMKKKYKQREFIRFEDEESNCEGINIEEIPDMSHNQPDKSLQHKELANYIKELIKQLPEEHALIFVLRKEESLSWKEISKITRIPEKQLRNIFSRITKELRGKTRKYID